MYRFVVIFLIILATHGDGWKMLLDKDLKNWEIFLGIPPKSENIPGSASSDSNGLKEKPLGLNNDPLDVFQVLESEGEPVLKISGQVYGSLTSRAEYENYHFKLEFKWGTKKWPPRLKKLRDSGILFHAVGEHGKLLNAWKQSLECQVQEGDCGDFLGLAGASANIPVTWIPGVKVPMYEPSGNLSQFAYVSQSLGKEYPNGEWNTIEVFTVQDTAVFVVNSTPNMALYNTTQKTVEGGRKPLMRGQIQIQSEGAEVYYRRIAIKSIKDFPENIKQRMKENP